MTFRIICASNHLYSVVALFSQAGVLAERYEYDAYGDPDIYNADFSQSYACSQQDNPYLFTDRRCDILDTGSSLKIYFRYINLCIEPQPYFSIVYSLIFSKDKMTYKTGAIA